MKRPLALAFLLFISVALISWGVTGHRTVALIAERHLTLQAKAAVADLLDGKSMADVSTWADEVRNTPEYKHTASWHFLNMPLGLSATQFEKAVTPLASPNVYHALLNNEQILLTGSNKEQRAVALKFIIHLVGDLHQPMHISRAEDKGGNTIQVQFDGKGTNLHGLWDSRLLDKQGLTPEQLAVKIDTLTKRDLKYANAIDIMQSLYTSYTASSKLYAEVETNNKLGDEYYKQHIDLVNARLELAGLKLAEILNRIFKDYKAADALKRIPNVKANEDGTVTKATQKQDSTAVFVPLDQVKEAYGQEIGTEGKVYGYKDLGSLILVNVGAAYPNQQLTVVLRGNAKKIASTLDGKTIVIIGKVTDYKGKPQIEITDLKSIIEKQ